MSYKTTTVKLSEVIDLISGGTPKTSIKEYWDGEIDWLSVVDFNRGNRYVSGASKKITELGLKNSATNLLNANDIIISARGTVGAIAQLEKSMAFNQSCYGVRGRDGISDTSYIYYVLKNAVKRLKEVSHGAVFDTITKDTFELINVDIPSLVVQKKIVSLLGCLDDKIMLLQKTNQTLEAIAQVIFKSWFVDFDPVHAKQQGVECAGIDKATADLFPNSFVESELGLIPKEWRLGNIGEIANVIDCLHSKKPDLLEAGYIYLQLNNIKDDGTLDTKKLSYISEQDYKKWTSRIEVKEGDCIITNVGRVGAVCQIPNNFKGAIGRNITAIRLKAAYPYPTFLIHLLLSPVIKKEIKNKTDSGTILDALNVKSIPLLTFIIPKNNILDRFEAVTRPLRFKVELNNNNIEELSNLRDSLLPRLMSGKLDLSNIEEQIEGVA